jgi:two-component system, cell cycle response regulator
MSSQQTGTSERPPAAVLPGLEHAPRGRASLEAALADLELLPYHDLHAAAEPALQLQAEALELGLHDLLVRARLITADVMGRNGDVAGAGKIARTAGEWAAAHGDDHVLARSERLLSTFHARIGDMATSLTHAVRAVELLDDGATPALRADHHMGLSVALARNGSYSAARDRLDTVFAIAEQTSDARLRLAALNNLAFIEYWAGEADAALNAAELMRLTAQRHSIPLQAAQLDTIARAHMMLGQYAEAERTLASTLQAGATNLNTEADDLAGNLLTVAECQRLRGAPELARATLELAQAECEERGLGGTLVEVMEQQAAVFAALGLYREAYERHVEFHRASEALSSAEREARARALRTVFETEEAQRESRQYREMSLRDPLTGLYNRRYLDDRLAALLGAAREELTQVSVALVDLDHFKRINDRATHEAGDEVLRRISTLLLKAAGETGFAARLGGEEFVLVLPATDLDAALARCEQLCDEVRRYDWSPIVGQLPVTVSIGVAATFAGSESASYLLGEADRGLYLSKNHGRDRVTAT